MKWEQTDGKFESNDGVFLCKIDYISHYERKVSISSVQAGSDTPVEVLNRRTESYEEAMFLCEGFMEGAYHSPDTNTLKSAKDYIRNLDTLPHMNRVLQWGTNSYFFDFDDMNKAIRAIGSALGGFEKEIQDHFSRLKIAENEIRE